MCEKKGLINGIVVAIITCVMLFGYFTRADNAVALSQGDVAKVSLKGYIKGIENKCYITDPNGSVLFYKENGGAYIKNITGKPVKKRTYIMLTDMETGKKHEGYCIEFDAKVRSNQSYTAQSYERDAIYFKNLPENVKKLMLAVTYYGCNGKNPVPVSNANKEDYYFATQMVIWEAQQQLRIFTRDENGRITGTELRSAHGMDKHFFYRFLKGRAAERCYDYIVENLNSHFVTPAFIGENAEMAEIVQLKYNMTTGKWHGSVDEEIKDFDMKWTDKDIQYEKGEESYEFTADAPFDGIKTLRIKRDTTEGSSAENLLIWHNADRNMQVMATGSASPPEFYARFKTDTPASVTIVKKDGETGKTVKLQGTSYKIRCLDLDTYLSEGMAKAEGDVYVTDENGVVKVNTKLSEGNYCLEEIQAPKGYTLAKEHLEFYVDGQREHIEIEQNNIPQKGIIVIKKTGEYKYKENWEDIREKAMGGIDFDIIALSDIITPDGTVRAKKGDVVDTVRTDFNGNVKSRPLYLGPYSVVEKDTPMEYRLCEPINIALIYSDQREEIIVKNVNVLNRLKRPGDSFGNTPKTGDTDNMNMVIMFMLFSITAAAVLALSVKVGKR